MPYAVKIGTATSATIHDEWTVVSPSLAMYTRSQSTGADTMRSRSAARKKVERAVMMLDSSRMPRNASSSTARSLVATSVPMSGTPRKYFSTR